MKKDVLAPYVGPLEAFPASEEAPEGMEIMETGDDFDYFVQFHKVSYERNGRSMHIDIMVPWATPIKPIPKGKKWPCLVYVQGNGFLATDTLWSMSTLVRIAEQGYVVASVEYGQEMGRGFAVEQLDDGEGMTPTVTEKEKKSVDIHNPNTIPALSEALDVKAAIRYLRLHAREYDIDETRIGLYGDSSGGHTALMAGITGDHALLPEEYPGVSCQVSCIVDWYGLTNMAKLPYYPCSVDGVTEKSITGMALGGVRPLENPEIVKKANPIAYLSRERDCPPILIMHGDRDPLVPFNQSVRLYEAMKELGKEVRLIKMKGGSHAYFGFKSEKAIETVIQYLNQYLM